MKFRERLRGALIGLAITIVSLPLAFGITLAMMPIWSWVERQTGVESIGHSGPAGWCYIATYFVVVVGCTLSWSSRIRRQGQKSAGNKL